MDVKTCSKGTVIFEEGDMGRTMYEVVSGVVGIFADYGKETEQKLVELKQGEVFGEMAVIEDFPRSATAVAMEDTELYEIPGIALNAYFAEKPEMIMAILRHLSTRVRDLTKDYSEVCNTINEAKGIQGNYEAESESLWTKLLKFAGIYKSSSLADPVAVELPRRAKGNDEGYAQRVMSYSKDGLIFRENDPSPCMYYIQEGEVGIYTGYGTAASKMLTKLHVGDFFGEMGMIENLPRSASAVAIGERTIVELIYPENLAELFQKNPARIMMMMDHLSFRLRKLTADYMRACKTAAEMAEANEDNLELPAETRAWIEYYTMLSMNGIAYY